jgi:hypothetical protein
MQQVKESNRDSKAFSTKGLTRPILALLVAEKAF